MSEPYTTTKAAIQAMRPCADRWRVFVAANPTLADDDRIWHPIGPGFAPIRAGGGTPTIGKVRPLLSLLPGQTRTFDAAGIEVVTTRTEGHPEGESHE